MCGFCGDTFPISSDLKKHAEEVHKSSCSSSSSSSSPARERTADPESNDVNSSPASLSAFSNQVKDESATSPKSQGN